MNHHVCVGFLSIIEIYDMDLYDTLQNSLAKPAKSTYFIVARCPSVNMYHGSKFSHLIIFFAFSVYDLCLSCLCLAVKGMCPCGICVYRLCVKILDIIYSFFDL